jgi:hypothetical protein
LRLERSWLLAVESTRAVVARHGARRHTCLRDVGGDRARRLADNLPPLVGSLWCVRLELHLVAHGEAAAQFASRHVFALDVELLPVHGTNHAIGQVEGEFGHGVFGKVVVRLELVEELGGRHDVVVCVVRTHDLALAFQRPRNQRLSSAVVLVGELDLRHSPRRRRRVNKDGVVALDEAVPLKVEGDLLAVSNHVAVGCLGVLGLRVHDLHKLSHTVLNRLENVRLELGERILDTDEILAIVVLFLNLLVEAMHNTALQNVGVVCSLQVTAVRVVRGRVLAEELDVLLGMGSGLVDLLAALARSFGQLLALVLDLGVQAFEDGQNGTLELFRGFVVLVGDSLIIVNNNRVYRRVGLTWVLDRMFSNMPAIPPSDWSK